jgi:pimeloyl-ACP methyl ester carboxylesterase
MSWIAPEPEQQTAPETTVVRIPVGRSADPGRAEMAVVADRCGPAGGPGVVLLHGGGQSRQAWKGATTRLGQAGYDTLAVDTRGHGDSDWAADGDYTLETLADDLDRYLALFDAPPVVVGASLGGMTALVNQGRSDEQRFRALILVDVTPRMEPDGVERIVRFMTEQPDGFASLAEAADAVAAYNPHRERPSNPDGLRRILREQNGRWMWRWDPAFIAPIAAEIAAPGGGEARTQKMSDLLHGAAVKVRVPTLLVRGQQSDLVSEQSVREFTAAVPHADYVDVSGTGHMVAGDDNDAFTDAVLTFLAGLPPTPAT